MDIEENDYAIFDVMEPSVAELVDGKISNVEQYQEILANMDPSKRSAYKLRLKNKQIENYANLQKLLRRVAKDLDKKVDAFKLAGGEVTFKNGIYTFNGFQATTDYKEKSDLNFEAEIANIEVKLQNLQTELDELEAKAKKALFAKSYKKQRREELKKQIEELNALKDSLTKEEKEFNEKAQKEKEAFEQAKDLLGSIDLISIIVNNMQKIHCLLAYMNKTNVHGLSASQFVKEFKPVRIDASPTLKNGDVVQSVINNNDTYRYKIPYETLTKFGDVAVNLKAPVSRKVSEKQDTQIKE